ncbi:MAG: hypothetical protein WAN60_01690 [Candidatus Sulfotelmatobacter sp.]
MSSATKSAAGLVDLKLVDLKPIDLKPIDQKPIDLEDDPRQTGPGASGRPEIFAPVTSRRGGY